MLRPHRRWILPAAGVCAIAAGGCGASTPPGGPSAGDLSQFRARLADARAAAAGRDRPAVTAALNALAHEVTFLRRQGRLTPALATALGTDLAQARRRAAVELPSPAPAAAAPAAPANPPAAAVPATPATGAAPPAAPDTGKAKDNGNGKPKGHGQGDGNGNGGGNGGD